MSLSSIVIDKSTDSALSSSRALSRFTSTTYAEAGTSLDTIVSDTRFAAKTSADSTGVSDATLYAPITTMRDAAISADPINAKAYTNFGKMAMDRTDTYAMSNLPGMNNSLFDIQKVGRESIGAGVGDFSSSIQSFNPLLASKVNGLGVNGLDSAGRSLDTLASSAFGGATKQISASVSGINNAMATKATEAAKSLSAATGTVKDLPGAGLFGGKSSGASSSTSTSSTSTSKVGSTSTSKIDDPIDFSINSTDVIYQDYKVYVEGVQIPFESLSVSQSLGQLPRAVIQIPPQAGLMDIARYYEPKVHIFYTDNNTGGDRIMFWGHIVAVNYAYSKEHASASITFECEHKNALMEQITFEWSAGGTGHATEGDNLTDMNPDQATIQLHNFNSDSTMVVALQGITGNQTDAKDLISPDNKAVIQADPTKLDKRFKDFENRMIGMPSVVMNLWNQVKREIFANQKLNLIFTKMYMPLVEDGIAFFDRMSGHYFVENQIDKTRQQHCNDNARPEASKYDTLLPPAFRMDIMSAANTQMALNTLNARLGFSNEQTNFYQLFYNFFYTIEYDMVTLASPSEIPVDPTVFVDLDDPKTWRSQKRMAVETVVKPQLPFYYSPICNVLLPNMFTSVSVNQAENVIPTRVTVMNTALSTATNSPSSIGSNYRAPHSIRESVALGKKLLGGEGSDPLITLQDTTASSYNVPGKYELGRGIKHKKLMMPSWLSYFSAGSNAKRSAQDDQVYPVDGTIEAKNLVDLQLAWIDRYGYSTQSTEAEDQGSAKRAEYKDVLNPYSRKSKIMAYERLLFAAADFDYTKEVVQSKTGTVECIFNPYIIPGYPMDIIDRSPNNPSFHALCASVTHSITSRSVSTSISFVAAVTYAELSNYFLPPSHPWLQTALKLVNVSRDDGKAKDSTVDSDTADAGTPPDNLAEEAKAKSADSKDKVTSQVGKAVPSMADQVSSRYGVEPKPDLDTNKGDVRSVSQTLLGNSRAVEVADQFYMSVLGVGAAYPNLIYNFTEGVPYPISRHAGRWAEGSADSLPTLNGGEGNDNLTGVGNLRLVRRQIESKASIEDKFDLKFIDMTPGNYNGAPAGYVNEILTNRTLLEPGASMFLDYEEISDFIGNAQGN
jgi:hypothetical protein